MAVIGDALVAYGVGSNEDYDGMFRNNKYHGFGKEEHRYGPLFIGEYKEGKRHGKMTFFP